MHGMDGRLVKPDWEPLTLLEVRDLLSHFPGCGEPIEILNVSPRPFSAASVVSTRSGRVFVKRHHGSVRDKEGLLEEHRLIAYLLAQGASVPRVFETSAGETAVVKNDWTYEVHEAPVDVDLYGEALSWSPFRTLEHARSAGRALARLNRAAEKFGAPRRGVRPLVASFTIFAAQNASSEMNRYVMARPALAGDNMVRRCCDQALELLAPFHAELRPLLPALKPLWTHNDLHASNLLWSDTGNDAQATTVIDFGLADLTTAVHDLAHAIERNVVEWLSLSKEAAHPENVAIRLDHLEELLSGYESVRPLSDVEAAALAPMTALCHAEFALSESDYFLRILHSSENAKLAYDGWLVGHARWFRGVGGNQLLNAIRRWANRRVHRIEGVRWL